MRTFDETAFRQAAAMLDQMNAGRLAALTPHERAQRLCTQAKGFLDRGLLLEAERLYQDAVAADGASAQAHAGLAEVRERSGDADGGAQGGSGRRWNWGPRPMRTLCWRSWILRQGHWTTANTEAGDALKLEPANRAAQDTDAAD